MHTLRRSFGRKAHQMDNQELELAVKNLQLEIEAAKKAMKSGKKTRTDTNKPIGAELRALAGSLSMHYKTTQRVLISFLLLAMLILCSPIDLSRQSCPQICEWMHKCVANHSSEGSATLLGITVKLHVFFPLALIVLNVLCYNYCHWFSLSFRVGGFFNQRVYERIFQEPAQARKGGKEQLTAENRALSADILHSLYFSTIFRTFAFTKDINYPWLPEFKKYFRLVANYTLVLLPICVSIFIEIAIWHQIGVWWYFPVLLSFWLAIIGTDVLYKSNKKFRECNDRIEKGKEKLKADALGNVETQSDI